MDPKSLVLLTGLHRPINEPTIEAAFERLTTRAGYVVTFEAFRDAAAACVRDGLIHEPVRLPDGALQCHWHLELTPKGVAAARALPPNMAE